MQIHSFPEHPILLVDDEAKALESFKFTLELNGVNNLILCQDETSVMNIIQEEDIEAILLDIVMPKKIGRKPA